MLCPRSLGCPSPSTDCVRRFLFPFSASPQFLPLKKRSLGSLPGGWWGWGWGRGIGRPGRWVGGWVRGWSFRRDCHCPLAWRSWRGLQEKKQQLTGRWGGHWPSSRGCARPAPPRSPRKGKVPSEEPAHFLPPSPPPSSAAPLPLFLLQLLFLFSPSPPPGWCPLPSICPGSL